MGPVKTPYAITVAAFAAVAIAPVAISARPQTTKPGVVYVVKAMVDNKGVHIPNGRYTKNGVSRYPRGVVIRYEFANKGTRPYEVHMWTASTHVMKPGGHASVLVNWSYRGTYHYWRVWRSRRLTPIGTVIIV
jgi:hypothetical protein